jgi:uncharacterized protein YqfB (UPF0267 family)
MELKISDDFSVDPSHIVTERTAIIGQSGSGKSYLVSVICEELASNDLGFVLLDTEGEYHGLSKFDNIRLIKETEEVEDISADEENIKRIIQDSQKIILDVSESDKNTVNEFLTGIYSVTTELFKANKSTPFLLIIEEADIYIPQKRTGGLEILQTISRRGRKRGLGILLATQRPALVNKNVLSQCNNVFIGKLMLKNDLDSVRLFFSSMDEVKQLTTLEPGYFYVQGAISDPTFIKIRARKTRHGGSTPKIPIRIAAEKISVDPSNESNTAKYVSTDEEQRIRRAINSIRSGKYGTYIDFNETQALKSIIDNRQKQHKLFGKYETIENVKPVMSPHFLLQIRETKKKVIGKKSDNYKVLVNSFTGDILDSKGEVRSQNVRQLFDLNPFQLQVMNFIRNNKKVTMVKLKENRSTKGLKLALRKLEDAHLIAVKDDHFLSLYDTKPKSLKSQSVNDLKTVEGTDHHAEKLKTSETKLQNIIKEIYPDCEVTDINLIYSPSFDIVYSNGSAERILRISALSGKAL